MNMAKPLLVSGALANAHGIGTEELLRFLSERLPDAELYKLCGVSAAALDWRGIFHDAGAASSIAGLLWMAYVEIVEPKKQDPKSDAGIYVVLGKDESQQFWIGKDYRVKKVFIKRFTKEVERIMETENRKGEIAREIEETRESNLWIRIK
jgi:hypothetical protein